MSSSSTRMPFQGDQSRRPAGYGQPGHYAAVVKALHNNAVYVLHIQLMSRPYEEPYYQSTVNGQFIGKAQVAFMTEFTDSGMNSCAAFIDREQLQYQRRC